MRFRLLNEFEAATSQKGNKGDFLAKSRIPALVTEISWLAAFAVGLWIFIALNI